MIFAIISAFCMAMSALCATRSIAYFGPLRALLLRAVVATSLLALFLFLFKAWAPHPEWPWFFWGGVLGNGLADIAMFQTMKKIGPRLCMILMLCLSVPVASVVDWLWLGTVLSSVEWTLIAVIILGVVFAVKPEPHHHHHRRHFLSGLTTGILAATFQGLGAVVARAGYHALPSQNLPYFGIPYLAERVVGGLVVIAIVTLLSEILFKKTISEKPIDAVFKRRAYLGAAGTILFGQFFGLAAFMWAIAHTPAAIVLPIIATTPLIVMALVWLIDGDRPSRRSLIGGVIAVSGVVGLKIISGH